VQPKVAHDTLILLRKKDVVKRRAGCFQKVDNVRLNVLAQEGYALTKDELAALSPYQTQHVKRFEHYELDLQTILCWLLGVSVPK
jgi:hypothetical protein